MLTRHLLSPTALFAGACAFLGSLQTVSAGPVNLASPFQAYTQGFDNLAIATNNGGAATRWTNDTTLSAWYVHRAGNSILEPNPGTFDAASTIYYVADGSFSPSSATLGYGVYSVGLAANSDRAIGAIPSSVTGEISLMVLFKNNRSYAMQLDEISYTAKAFRKNSSFTAERITLSYLIVDDFAALQAAMLTQAGTNGRTVTGWTKIENATALFPMTETDAAGLPATLLSPPTTVELDGIIPRSAAGAPLAIQVPSGRLLALRWGNANDNGTDGIIGLDDVRAEFSEQVCDILATQVGTATRLPGVSATDPLDDVISVQVEIQPSGSASSSLYRIVSPTAIAATDISYGVRTLNIPVSAFSGSSEFATTLRLEDVVNPACVASLKITAPSCSHSVIAQNPVITGSTYSIQLTITGTYVAQDFTISTSPVVTGKLGDTITISGLPLSSTVSARLRDTAPDGDPAFANCSTVLSFVPPRVLGENHVTTQPFYTSISPTDSNSPWNVDSTTKTASLQNAGAEEGGSVRSEKIDLTGITDLVRFRGELYVAESDQISNFETDDQVKVELLLDEGLATEQTLSLTNRYDRRAFFYPAGDNWINGFTGGNGLPYNAYRIFDEFNLTAVSNNTGLADLDTLSGTLPLSVELPAGTKSVRLIATGDNDSADEMFQLKNMILEIVTPELLVSTPTTVSRIETEPGDATKDLVEFTVTISNPIGGTGWMANALPNSGVFGTVTLRIPVTQTSVTFTDKTYPTLTQTVPIVAPRRYVLGNNILTGGKISTKLDTFPDAEWVNDEAAQTLRLSDSAGVEKTVVSEIVSLANVAGDVEVSLVLEATDSSSSTNFEANDQFRAELILDGNTAAPLSLINPLWDRNEFTGARVGYLNGYDGSDEFPYNSHTTRDEFNRNEVSPFNFGHYTASGRFTARFELKTRIPDSVQTVQIRILGANNSTTEAFVVSELTIDESRVDTDNDGMTDAYELAHGLNTTDPDDAEEDEDGDGVGNLDEFLLGTPANQPGPRGVLISSIQAVSSTEYQLTFPAAAGIRYQVEFSTDLKLWEEIGEIVKGTGTTQTIAKIPVTHAGSKKAFFRLKIVP